MVTTEKKSPVEMIMGYEATRTEEGHLIIHDVPIFCACERGGIQFDDDWLGAAVRHAMQQELEDFFPPLHIRHHEAIHEANDSVRKAGFFRITGTARITLGGKRRNAIMADLVITDAWAAEEVMSLQLPYRSVEIFNVEEPSIDSLALLDHEAPFLELPMLKVSQVEDGAPSGVASATFGRDWQMDSRRTGSPVVACFRKGEFVSLLYEASIMASKKKSTGKKTATSTTATMTSDDKDDETKPPDGENAEAEEGGEDLDSMAATLAKAIENGSISVNAEDMILAAIQKRRTESPLEEEEETPAPAPTPEAMKKSDNPEVEALRKEVASLKGVTFALKKSGEQRDKNDVRGENVKDAMQLLEDKPMGSEVEKYLTEFHTEHGAAAFKAHVEALAKTFASVGLGDDTAERFLTQQGSTSEVALLFQEHGPDIVSEAAEASLDYHKLKASMGQMRQTEEQYVKTHMQRTRKITLKKAS